MKIPAHILNQENFDDEVDLNQLPPLLQSARIEHPHLFSSASVYISSDELNEIKKIIEAIEFVIKNQNFDKRVINEAFSLAQLNLDTKGVFMGYDFHLTENGPKLIEINTNAGGALLSFELARIKFNSKNGVNLYPDFDEKIIEMFFLEWKLARGEERLETIVIVDDHPQDQFLYPEFILFKDLFEKHGLKAFIASPEELNLRDGKLYFHNIRVDLIYNRLTDFYLEESGNNQIKLAYEHNQVVLTPSPFHHSHFANKSNLSFLSDRKLLEEWKIKPQVIEILAKGIPETFNVTADNQLDLWERRKNFFFKPVAGFGSKATYRGDKLTHRVWEEICHQKYVAQEFVQPSKRKVKISDAVKELKADLRAYSYDGEIQFLTARLYEGQTTNFRSEGGGFARVLVV